MRIARVMVGLAVLALVISACTPAAPAATTKTFGMVTDQAGLGDQGFNDTSWAGLQKA